MFSCFISLQTIVSRIILFENVPLHSHLLPEMPHSTGRNALMFPCAAEQTILRDHPRGPRASDIISSTASLSIMRLCGSEAQKHHGRCQRSVEAVRSFEKRGSRQGRRERRKGKRTARSSLGSCLESFEGQCDEDEDVVEGAKLALQRLRVCRQDPGDLAAPHELLESLGRRTAILPLVVIAYDHKRASSHFP